MSSIPINDATDLGHAIRAARRRLKYTQRELAGLSGNGTRFIVELERGKPTIEFAKALGVARILGLTLTLRDDA